MKAAVVLVLSLCFSSAFKSLWKAGSKKTRLWVTVPEPSTEDEGTSRNGVPPLDLDEEDPEYEKKIAALDLLDVLTCTDNEDDPEYDVSKDIRRDKLLMNNDYHDLKIQLRKKGLRTGGDKEEMIARLLLHVIDPSVDYMEATGREPTLSYVDESDIESGKVALIPEAQRNKQGYDFNGRPSMREDEEEEDENASIFTRQVANDLGRVDAEDLQVLRPRKILTSANNEVGGGVEKQKTAVDAAGKGGQVMMDGLTRQEIVFKAIQISRDATQARREDGREERIGDNAPTEEKAQLSPYIRGYLVGGRDVLRTWERNPTVVVLLPDVLTQEALSTSTLSSSDGDGESGTTRAERDRRGGGWRSKGVRVMADEIAFNMQCIVIVPDLARGLEGVEMGQRSSQASENEEDEEGSTPQECAKDYATRRRLFDDIAGTIAFAQTEYESESVCLAGLRSGAGLALEASCDLYNMACLSQIYAMDDFQGVDRDGGGGGEGGGAEQWNMCGGLWREQGRMAPQPPQSLNYYRALAQQGTSESSYLDEYFAAEDGSLYDDSEWIGGAAWTDDLTADGEDQEMDLSEAELELMAENMLAELAQEEGEDADIDGEGENEQEPEVIEGHASAYFEGTSEEAREQELTNVSDADVQAALEKASGGPESASRAKTTSADASEERERLMALMEGERAEIAALIRRADEVAATNALTRNTLSSSSVLALNSIPSLLPRALFLVDPTMYDQKRVQQELRLPSFFVYGCSDATADKARLGSGDEKATPANDGSVRGSDRADLLFSLKKRRHEVVDFCVRQYEGVSGKFLSEPVTAEDAVCGQEAIVIGSAWLDIYGRKLASVRPYKNNRDEEAEELAMDENDGNGGDRDSGNKGLADMGYSEDSQVLAQTKFDTPFVRISAEELGGTARIAKLIRQAEEEARASGESEEVKRAFKRPSPIATFLHDDDQLYRDGPKDGWEFTQSV
jgi:hypothetical protein